MKIQLTPYLERRRTLLSTLGKLERLGEIATTLHVAEGSCMHKIINERAITIVMRAGFENGSAFLTECANDPQLGDSPRCPIYMTSPVAHLALIGA